LLGEGRTGDGNGRALGDNAFDIAVAVLAGSPVASTSAPRHPTPAFPYLSAPHPPPCRPSSTSMSRSRSGTACLAARSAEAERIWTS
jgi:hypothetical protein